MRILHYIGSQYILSIYAERSLHAEQCWEPWNICNRYLPSKGSFRSCLFHYLIFLVFNTQCVIKINVIKEERRRKVNSIDIMIWISLNNNDCIHRPCLEKTKGSFHLPSDGENFETPLCSSKAVSQKYLKCLRFLWSYLQVGQHCLSMNYL